MAGEDVRTSSVTYQLCMRNLTQRTSDGSVCLGQVAESGFQKAFAKSLLNGEDVFNVSVLTIHKVPGSMTFDYIIECMDNYQPGVQLRYSVTVMWQGALFVCSFSIFTDLLRSSMVISLHI